jgi:hypothetical protein
MFSCPAGVCWEANIYLVNLVKDDVDNRKKLPVGLGKRRREHTLTIVIKS